MEGSVILISGDSSSDYNRVVKSRYSEEPSNILFYLDFGGLVQVINVKFLSITVLNCLAF